MEISHSFHEHPLSIIDITDDNKFMRFKIHNGEAHCFACGLTPSGTTYGCSRSFCPFIIHEPCLELPPRISHPFHPDHLLTLRSGITSDCKACGVVVYGFRYHCNKCFFSLHTQCAALAPAITHENHEHPLNLLTNKHIEPWKRSSSALVMSCVRCEFLSIGLEGWFPCPEISDPNSTILGLPHTITHERHVHPLKYTDCVVDDEDDEFYCCDICEIERHPKLPVYYCSECNFIAHASCVTFKVAPSIEGEWSFFLPMLRHKWDTSTLVREIINMVLRKAVKENNMGKDDGTSEEEEEGSDQDINLGENKISMLRAQIEKLTAKLEKKKAKLKAAENRAT